MGSTSGKCVCSLGVLHPPVPIHPSLFSHTRFVSPLLTHANVGAEGWCSNGVRISPPFVRNLVLLARPLIQCTDTIPTTHCWAICHSTHRHAQVWWLHAISALYYYMLATTTNTSMGRRPKMASCQRCSMLGEGCASIAYIDCGI